MAYEGKLGFVGLGEMGQKNLLKANFEVYVFDLRQEAMDSVVKLGAQPVNNLEELMNICDVVHVAVWSEDQVNDVVHELLQAGGPNKKILIHSTVSPQTVTDLVDKVAEKKVQIVDAPMSGAEKGAEEGTLTFMVGCNTEELMESLLPIFNSLGEHTYYMGLAGAASATKLANNVIALSTNLLIIEAIKLAEGYGVEEDKLIDVLRTSSGNSFIVQNWDSAGKFLQTHPLAGTEEIYSIPNKDISIAVESAKKASISLPIIELANRLSPQMLEDRDKNNRENGRIYLSNNKQS